MNGYLKAFRVITFIGILTNLTFLLSSVFYPALLNNATTGGTVDYGGDPWLFNTGMLLLLNAAFYFPAARDPLRDRLYTWLTAWSRVFAAASWIVYLVTIGASLPSGFWTFPLSDGTMGVLSVILVRLGLRDEARS
ncbi:MAG TPA: hypothetical protein VIC28_17910 [Thermoanaerobaculia bacterium]